MCCKNPSAWPVNKSPLRPEALGAVGYNESCLNSLKSGLQSGWPICKGIERVVQ